MDTFVPDLKCCSVNRKGRPGLGETMADKFNIHTDRYNGVIIDAAKQSFKTDAEFVENLKVAIPQWKAESKRGLWLEVHHKNSGLVPLLSQMGFEFHHAQPGYVMMTLWISDDQPNHLPEYANQYIGVAGFVVNERKQLLVIQERYHINAHSPWKLPGGHADRGEDLPQTAVREVLEETGVKCKFKSLMAFRHQHNYRFGCSDIYFICLMEPITQEINACPVEIAACKWMDLDEFINDSGISDVNRHFAKCYMDGLEQANGLAIVPTKVLSYTQRDLHYVYSIQSLSNPHPDHKLPGTDIAGSTLLH